MYHKHSQSISIQTLTVINTDTFSTHDSTGIKLKKKKKKNYFLICHYMFRKTVVSYTSYIFVVVIFCLLLFPNIFDGEYAYAITLCDFNFNL